MKAHVFSFVALSAAAALLSTIAIAHADVRTPTDAPPSFGKECGSCHVAFPPQMMRGEDWRRLMGGLDKHFGTDASVSDAERREIGEFIARHAASDGDQRRAAENMRVSATAWFQREHREIDQATWQHPEVIRASNCGACHTTADQGRFGHRVRIPGKDAK